MQNKLVTIATFSYPSELMIIKNILDNEQIKYFVMDQNTVQVFNFYSNAIGGIKLKVFEEDVENAIRILKDAQLI